MSQCLISLRAERRTDASKSKPLILLLLILVLVLYIVLQVSVKKIIRCVWLKESFIQMILPCLLIRTVSSTKIVPFMKDFMLKMLTKSSLKTLKIKEELF